MSATERRDAEGNFLGLSGRECGEHRTVGTYRAWCHDCGEWCSPQSPCARCELPPLRTELDVLRAERDRLVESRTFWRTWVGHLQAERPALLAELDRVRPVVEAAEQWAERWSHPLGPSYAGARRLRDAVAAYRAGSSAVINP